MLITTRKMSKLSIIIPAKNEEKRIARTLSNYGSYFFARKDILDVEIIVVINGTTDSTPSIVSEYSSKYPFIRKLITPYSSGKGGAVALGFKSATGDYVGFTDADGAVSPSEFYKLFNFLEETPWLDGAIGSRDFSSVSKKRRMIARFFNLYARLIFNLPYQDTQCGAKIFKKSLTKEISSKLSDTGWTFDLNLLLVARYLNANIREMNIKWNEKEGSQFLLSHGLVGVLLEFISLKKKEATYNLNKFLTKLFDSAVKSKVVNASSKRILILAWRDMKHPDVGGSEVYTHQVAKRLAKKHDVMLFTSKPGNLSSYEEMDGVRIFRRGGFLTVYFWAFVYYIRFFRKHIDLIIDVENGIPFFTPLYSRKPIIMLLHHVHKKQWFNQFKLPLSIVGYVIESLLMPLVYRNTPVVTVSPSSMRDLRSLGFKDKKIFLGYNSIPPKVGKSFERSKDPLLLYVGRVKSYKRIEHAIKALSVLKVKYPKVKLIVAGTGDHIPALKEYAEKLGVIDHVTFEGFVSEQRKWYLLQTAWVFLMPSMREGWGITIVEAAHCGTPAVGYNVAGVRDSIRDNLTGLLANDFYDFVNKVSYLLSSKKMRSFFGDFCVRWSHSFNWNNTTEVFEILIKDQFAGNSLLDNKIYPWELDKGSEAISSIAP